MFGVYFQGVNCRMCHPYLISLNNKLFKLILRYMIFDNACFDKYYACMHPLCVCVCMCVRACMRACVCMWVHVSVHACGV